MRGELTDVARNNNFIIKYDKYDWNLNLTRVGYAVPGLNFPCACLQPYNALSQRFWAVASNRFGCPARFD